MPYESLVDRLRYPLWVERAANQSWSELAPENAKAMAEAAARIEQLEAELNKKCPG